MSQENRANRKYIAKIQEAMTLKPITSSYAYDDRDVILYNIALGARRTDLDLVYENSQDFQALPTFGIVPTYSAQSAFSVKDIVPNYDQRMLLHGEQYLEITQFPIPTSGTLKTETRLIEVVDKGNAALVRRGSTTVDGSGRPVFYNENVAFIRGSGGFGGQKKPSDRGASTAANTPPSRAPDKVVEEKTSDDVAALYRLMGDRNPLHIDPEFSAAGGFPIPILHGPGDVWHQWQACSPGVWPFQEHQGALQWHGIAGTDNRHGDVEGGRQDHISSQGEGDWQAVHQQRCSRAVAGGPQGYDLAVQGRKNHRLPRCFLHSRLRMPRASCPSDCAASRLPLIGGRAEESDFDSVLSLWQERSSHRVLRFAQSLRHLCLTACLETNALGMYDTLCPPTFSSSQLPLSLESTSTEASRGVAVPLTLRTPQR